MDCSPWGRRESKRETQASGSGSSTSSVHPAAFQQLKMITGHKRGALG